MSQVNDILRKVQGGYSHYCTGCDEMHVLPGTWKFDDNLERPTFTPSFKHEGIQRVFVSGHWTGEWKRDSGGNTIPYICHYILTNVILNYCGDTTHSLAGKSIPIPSLPEGYRD